MIARRTMLAGLTALPFSARISGAQAASSLKIGTIGAGQVGGTLGALWVKAGCRVMFSARDLAQARKVAQSLGPLASAGTPQEAAAFGDVLLLAVPYRAVPELGRELNAALAGKILLDATNPYSYRDGAIADEADRDGAGPTTQRYFPNARVVRGFNSIAMSTLRREAHRAPPPLGVPVATNHQDALPPVIELVRAAGFDPVVIGDLSSATRFQPGHAGFLMERNATELKAALAHDD